MARGIKMTACYMTACVQIVLFSVILTSLPRASHQSFVNKHSIHDLRDGEEITTSGPNRFCYRNTISPTWRQTFTRIQVKVWSKGVFKVVTVEGEDELMQLDRFSILGWFQSLLREKHNETSINVNLYNNKTCFQVDPTGKPPYTVKLLRKFDVYLFLVFLAGGTLFFFSDSLSKSHSFFYCAGMSTGMMASIIILCYILARFLPKKNSFYVLILSGWSFSIYAIQLVFRNLGVILQEHWHAVIGYVAVVGFISFAVCYRYGPLVDQKSINILSWTLQVFGLLLIYFGNQIQQVAFAFIGAAVMTKYCDYPIRLAILAYRKMRRYVRWKPEPRRLLTEEEYQKEGEEETRRALDELRKYCNSPEFSPWKAVSRLQSPKRFADFVEGSPHLMPNEASVHAQEYGFGGSFFENEFFDTDDEDDDDDQNHNSGDNNRQLVKTQWDQASFLTQRRLL